MRDALQRIHWVKFRNDAVSTAPAFGCLRITGFVTDPEESFFTVGQPNIYGSQYSHAINDALDVPSGEYGYCALGQMVPALYDDVDGTPNFGEPWGPRNGTWKLKKNTGGFQTFGLTNALDKTALVVQKPFLVFRGTADADISADAAGTVSIFYRSGSTTYTDTTVNMSSVLNDLDDTVTSGSVVEVRFDPVNDGTISWKITQSDC